MQMYIICILSTLYVPEQALSSCNRNTDMVVNLHCTWKKHLGMNEPKYLAGHKACIVSEKQVFGVLAFFVIINQLPLRPCYIDFILLLCQWISSTSQVIRLLGELRERPGIYGSSAMAQLVGSSFSLYSLFILLIYIALTSFSASYRKQ